MCWKLPRLSAVVCCQGPGCCLASHSHLHLVLLGRSLVWTVSGTLSQAIQLGCLQVQACMHGCRHACMDAGMHV
jgi:hypothetical protein